MRVGEISDIGCNPPLHLSSRMGTIAQLPLQSHLLYKSGESDIQTNKLMRQKIIRCNLEFRFPTIVVHGG